MCIVPKKLLFLQRKFGTINHEVLMIAWMKYQVCYRFFVKVAHPLTVHAVLFFGYRRKSLVSKVVSKVVGLLNPMVFRSIAYIDGYRARRSCSFVSSSSDWSW